ncbi:GcrA family cell cycle regulator [Maritalea sp.]|jgi:hypothetical protein|uniref:GcrA family cell cycle regulator n=1 Tax=Maritalea sp. TaxID=2003361 RepID=UPI0039E6A6DE
MNAILAQLPPWKTLQKASKLAVINIMDRDGISAGQVAEQLGCSRNAILGFKHREKLKTGEICIVAEAAVASEKATTIKKKRGQVDASLRHKLLYRFDPEKQAASAQQNTKVGVLKAITMGHYANRHALLITFMELDARSCRWPIETGMSTRFCGLDTGVASETYCREHSMLAKGTWKAPVDDWPIYQVEATHVL